jgi:hypothetical protein
MDEGSFFLSGEDLTTQAGLAVQQDLALVACSACRTSSAMAITSSTASPAGPKARPAPISRRIPTCTRLSGGKPRLRIRSGR